MDRVLEASSGDESEEAEAEPPLVAVRRKVSFADAFGLNLVSVKEYDNRDSSRLDSDGREGEEYYISCLFNVPALHPGHGGETSAAEAGTGAHRTAPWIHHDPGHCSRA